MNIRPDANVHDVTYIVFPASMATTKQAYKVRVKSKLRRLRSKLFLGDKKKLQSTLFENLNVDKTVKKSYDKYIHCVSRSAPYQSSKLLLPARMRGDGADDVTLAELPLRTRGDGAEDDNTWKSPARTHGERTDGDVIGPRSLCDLDAAFLLEDETSDVCDLDISMIDDVSVTSYHDIAFVEEGDSVFALEKNVFDDVEVAITTLTRLRSVFSEGGNIEAVVSDSALESFMRD
ncbi:hypothetical protein DPMN_152067 [Dreissena polymorpha]|uniref:Uncharacterized protein n=1 Tax=Dreissena polymorpha TaxID=45954 RepID=A0A9D4J7K2_DREPO|nr:hypothetical protein DPMN_152067 [Dreissena polymorpha]